MSVTYRRTHRPLQVHYRQTRPHRGKAPIIAIVAVAGVAVASQAQALAGLLPAPTPTVTVTTTATPSTPTPTSDTPTGSPEPLREGHDYTFMRKIGGEPLSWSCTAPILVATAGDVPGGTQEALALAVGELRGASRLPLQVTGPDSTADITVHYVAHGTTRGHITLDGDALGKGGPVSTNDRITSGLALILSGDPLTDPTTPDGVAVLIHELAHALGLSHADQSTGNLMVPIHSAGDGPALGPGDKAGLEQLGCP